MSCVVEHKPSGPGAMLVGELRMRSSTLSGEHKREGGVEIGGGGGGGEDGEERGGVKTGREI